MIHFPLKPRLEALLRCDSFEFAMDYEVWRPQGTEGIVSDVYDCAKWKAKFGPPPPLNDPANCRIKLLFCYDGIPANNHPGSESLVPGEVMILSHPPWLRYKADNILICLLFQDHMSGEEQKKFFDHIIEVDFKPLFIEGVKSPSGDMIPVEIFAHVRDRCPWHACP